MFGLLALIIHKLLKIIYIHINSSIECALYISQPIMIFLCVGKIGITYLLVLLGTFLYVCS